MSQFNSIISSRGLSIHSKLALWKYNLTDIEFENLKYSFRFIDRVSQLNPKDCALYYAEWWKRHYNGGKPSKELIFDSLNINSRYFNAYDFYDSAKKGGDILNFDWIRNRNTLYFKTLLLQGGLPLNHVKNNSGNYRSFLLAILELNPYQVEDFSKNEDIVALLPNSSQNDIVYESCLQIIRAIIDHDERSILEFSEISDLKLITEELIHKRKTVNIKPLKINFKYNLNTNKKEIFLNISLPTFINLEDFSILLKLDQEEINDNEYSLFVNNNFCANFIKRNDKAYKITSFTSKIIISEFLKPEISISDTNGKIYYLNHLLDNFIKLDKPTLWISTDFDNNILVLEKSRRTSAKKAYLLVPCNENYTFENYLFKEQLTLLNNDFEFVEFNNEIFINSTNSNTYKFYCNKAKSFDWIFYSEEQNWVIQSSNNIVTGHIKLRAFDNNNQVIKNISVLYKPTKSSVWKDYSKNTYLPIGPLDVKIISGIDEEFDSIYNIGNIDFKYHLDVRNPKIEILNSINLISEIYNSEFFSTEITENTINFTLNQTSKLPSSVKIRLSVQNELRGLILKIKSPFQGVEIINNYDEVVNNSLFSDNLKGFRLIANVEENIYEIVFYNNMNRQLRITRSISKNITSLQEFQSIYNKLFRLFNIIDVENFVTIKINKINKNGSAQNIKTFELKQFSKNIKWNLNGDSKIIFENTEDIEFENLFVIPLDCTINHINKIELINDSGHYKIANEVADKYIIFSNNTSNQKIKPEFISINPFNILTDDNDRILRITNYKNQLLETEIDDNVWNKFLIYYYLCKDNNLPFSTFDILKSITISSELAAKAFFFLVHHLENTSNTDFSEFDFLLLQNDLGFSFNWVNKDHWHSSLKSFGFDSKFLHALTRMYNVMSSTFILNEDSKDSKFILNPEFLNLRSRLGSKALSELPTYRLDLIPENYRTKIPDIGNNENLILLASFTLLISLSITGEDKSLWHPQKEITRRKILYLMELDNLWYRQSLHYYLTINHD